MCTDLHINTHTRLFLSGLIFILVYFSSSTLYEIFCSPVIPRNVDAMEEVNTLVLFLSCYRL